MCSLPSHASGINIIKTCGRERPHKVSNSIMLSRLAESDCPCSTTGSSISISSLVKNCEINPFSLVRSQFRFPCKVLISPLCAIYLKGCASFQEGKVLVAKREWIKPNADTIFLLLRSGKYSRSWRLVSWPL